MQRRRLWTAAVSGMVAVTLLAGCSPTSPNGSGSADGPVTLTVQQQTNQEKLFGFVAKEFKKKYPNVTVKLETVSQDQKNGSNLAVLGSSSPPDVGMIPINSEVYTQLTAANALVPLTDVWKAESLQQRYGDAVANSLLVKNVPYTATFSTVIYNVVWYNPDIFKKIGLAEPKDHRIQSVDELIADAKALRAAGYGPLQIGGSSGYHASWMLDGLLPTGVSSDSMTNYLQSYDPSVEVTAKYTDPAFVDVLSTLERYRTSGVYQDGFLGQDAATAIAPFQRGKAGMALGGNFDTAGFDKEKITFTPGWALFPSVDGGTPTQLTLYSGDAVGIPAKSDAIPWAKKFIAFLMSDDMQKRAIVDSAGLLPAVNTVSGDSLKGLPDLTQQLVAEVSKDGGQPGWTATVPGGFGQQYIDPLLQKMYSGSLSPQQLAQQQQAHLEEFRKKGS